MKTRMSLLVVASAGMLASCQGTGTYVKIADGPDVEYAKAKCSIASTSVEQSVFAYGSPGYVAGAQLGNAIGNEIRKAEFVNNCMVMHGWKQATPEQVKAMQARQQRVPGRQPVQQQQAQAPQVKSASQFYGQPAYGQTAYSGYRGGIRTGI